MKNSDIEKMLKDAASGFVPDVLDKVMKAEITVEPIAEEVKTGSFNLRRLAFAMASVLILLVGGLSFFGIMNKEAGRVYIDVNPSLEIVYNHFDRVSEINFLNNDAEELITQDLEGEKIDTVLTMFIEKAEEKGYFSQEEPVIVISVSSKDAEKAEKQLAKLTEKAQNYTKEKHIEVSIEKQNASDINKEEAASLDISPGKLKIIKQLQQYNSEYRTEELSVKSMSELVRLLKDYEKNGNNGNNDNNGNGNGGGNGNGNGGENNGSKEDAASGDNGQNDGNGNGGQNNGSEEDAASGDNRQNNGSEDRGEEQNGNDNGKGNDNEAIKTFKEIMRADKKSKKEA